MIFMVVSSLEDSASQPFVLPSKFQYIRENIVVSLPLLTNRSHSITKAKAQELGITSPRASRLVNVMWFLIAAFQFRVFAN